MGRPTNKHTQNESDDLCFGEDPGATVQDNVQEQPRGTYLAEGLGEAQGPMQRLWQILCGGHPNPPP